MNFTNYLAFIIFIKNNAKCFIPIIKQLKLIYFHENKNIKQDIKNKTHITKRNKVIDIIEIVRDDLSYPLLCQPEK